jgi:DNA-binding transcriptional LysR family regulator
VELTPAGRSLLAITHRLFESEARALDILCESQALRAGLLRVWPTARSI